MACITECLPHGMPTAVHLSPALKHGVAQKSLVSMAHQSPQLGTGDAAVLSKPAIVHRSASATWTTRRTGFLRQSRQGALLPSHLCESGRVELRARWQEVRSPSGPYKALRPSTVCQVAGAAVPADPLGVPVEEVADSPEKASLGRKLRALGFYLWTFLLAIPLFVSMLLMHPFILLLDKIKRRAHHWVNGLWATATMALFYKVEIQGRENLPPPGAAAVYVANHQSFLDIFTLFALGRPFKFISKTENFLIPLIGWSMFLTGHVPLKRLDSRSQRECLMKCLDLLKKGGSVLFFPEGTRTKDGKMDTFKKGAFSVAAKANVPVVPITLVGTGHLMPNTQEGTLRGGKVTVVVHPALEGGNADELCEKSRAVIAETLVSYGLGVH